MAEVTGLSLEKIQDGTKFVRAGGGTSLGVGLAHAIGHKIPLDGIAIVSDGGENTAPLFAKAYQDYQKAMGMEPPIYLYRVKGEDDVLSSNLAHAGIALTKHDLTHGKVDYYSIPNLVQTMNANQFSLVDKVMACPLITLDQVLPLVKEFSHA